MNLAKFSEMFDKKKTFRPKKKFQPGTMKYSLHKQAQASLNSGINLRQVVKLPKVNRKRPKQNFSQKNLTFREKISMTGWLFTWWISSTELTSYMALCVNR